MSTSDWIQVASWIVTFILGVAAAIIAQRLTTKKKIVAWALLSENDLFPREISADLGVPVRVLVGSSEQDSLSSVRVRIGGGGDEVVENVSLAVNFNQSSIILQVRPVDDLGEFAKYVRWEIKENSCRIQADFLNPGKRIELEFLVSGYETSSVNVDLAAPGVELRRRDPTRWDVPTSWLQGFTLQLMGIRYDPTAATMREIAEELRGLRRQLSDTKYKRVTSALDAGGEGTLTRVEGEHGNSLPPGGIDRRTSAK